MAACKPQVFDYFLVLDFEANGDHKIIYPMEIIEFPVIIVNAKTLKNVAEFQYYVEPKVNKELCEYCTKVTGITSEMVAGQPSLQEVMAKLADWLGEKGMFEEGVTYTFITCGDWDLKTQLPRETKLWGYDLPPYFTRWVNIKKIFQTVTGTKGRGMMEMLKHLRIPHAGRHHSGIDDTRNIAEIVKTLVRMGAVIETTGTL